jgi:putative DNA primase/helicase
MTSLRTAAAKYASLGYAIIPVHWIREDGSCSCGDWSCSKPGKHPIGKHGASDPITDAEAATQQWEELPHANIGIVGGPTGWLIVDIDSEQARDHFKSIADYETIEAMKNAPISKTGKGWHFIFRDDERSYGPSVGSGEDTGIDIRAGISFIVAPPSTHVSGHQYAWLNGAPPFDPPQPTRWLRNYIETRKNNDRTIIHDAMAIPEGSRAKTIAELGGVMRRRGFNEEEIRTALTSVNTRANNPPLPQSEINNTAHSIAKYPPTEVPASLEIANTSTTDLINRLNGLNTRNLVDNDPPIIEWVWQDYLAPGTLNMLHGDGGLGKRRRKRRKPDPPPHPQHNHHRQRRAANLHSGRTHPRLRRENHSPLPMDRRHPQTAPSHNRLATRPMEWRRERTNGSRQNATPPSQSRRTLPLRHLPTPPR